MVSGGIIRRHEGKRKKSTNMSKTTVLQGPDENPGQFYAQLCEAFHLYTPSDPEAAKHQRMISAAFVSQAQGDTK
jgi:hypothetical protein